MTPRKDGDLVSPLSWGNAIETEDVAGSIPVLTANHQPKGANMPNQETIIVVDLETTHVDTDKAEIVEFAALRRFQEWGAEPNNGGMEICSHLVKPPCAIPPEASAVHHLTDEDVSEAPTLQYVSHHVDAFVDNQNAILAGHNILNYDFPLLQRHMPVTFGAWPKERVLDTLRLAKHCWPGLPSYALEVLKYRFGLFPEKMSNLGSLKNGAEDDPHGMRFSPHAAIYDVLTTSNLLEELAFAVEAGEMYNYLPEGTKPPESYADLCAFAQLPIHVETMYFGKHDGTPVDQLPDRYVSWMSRQNDMKKEHPDLFATLERYGML